MWLDRRQRGPPRKNLHRLAQEDLPTDLFAHAHAFGVAECQLHGWFFDMYHHCQVG